MADVQLENGFLKIANELAEAFSRLQLSGHEWRVLWAIIRRTYGWNKKEDWISGEQIAQDTGMNRVRVCEALRALAARQIIVHEGRRTAIQKDYDLWRDVTENRNIQNVTENRNGVTENRNKKLRKTVHTKYNKDTLQNTAARTEKDKGQEGMDLLIPLADLCKYDLAVINTSQKNDLYYTVGKLMNGARASPADIKQFGDFWAAMDWRGKKGQPPEPRQVLEKWGAFRSWQSNPTGGSKPKARFL